MPEKAIRLFVVCIIILMSSVLADEPQPALRSIAVLEFEAKGVSALEASTLTDRFRSELVRTEQFVQIERSKIEQLFKEQKLQLSGTVSDEKLVEIGELLGAELLVIGSIGKVGSTYTIDLRLVEVESGTIVASYFKDHRGAVDGLLDQFRVIAGEIAGKELEPQTQNSSGGTNISMMSSAASSMTLASAQMKARNDAKADFSKVVWGGGGAASGTTGGCLLGLPGGLVATGAVAGAAYAVDANPPQARLDELATVDPMIKAAYIQSYEEQLKKQRATWGGGGGTLGCCVGTMIAVIILSSTTSTTY